MKRTSLVMIGMLVLIFAASIAGFAQNATPEVTPDVTPNAGVNVRDTRYCEILPVALQQGKLIASVYNTLGHNDCPAEAWQALDVNAIKQQFHAVYVLMNGPRYWLMDQIIGKGATRNGDNVVIGGLGFTKRAEVTLTLTDMKTIPYQTREIQRDTEYIFDAGKPIYELIAPDGSTYVMQTYSQQVDATLAMTDLATLADRLKLPSGWKYQVVVLDHDLTLSAHGVAHLVQDDLDNSYQRIEPSDLGTPEATESATAAATVEATAAA
ncbi:MAG TPA: hypothetical protein VHD90_25105 [Phototrophicaceae bacterium]|nr:hypothetical protein [Phototrophicaceae bacterium]